MKHIVYRDIRELSEPEKDIRKRIDDAHKEAHDALSNVFYGKKRSVGVTVEEAETFRVEHAAIHDKHDQDLIDAGLAWLKTDNDRMALEEQDLRNRIDELNILRAEKGLRQLEIS